MDAIIVRITRTVASHPRLCILSYLRYHGETIPTVLAKKLGMPLPTLSAHVKLLSVAGLALSRKSGAKCYCSAASPYGSQTLSGQISEWLCTVLAKVRKGDKAQERSVHAVIFEAATAFTDLRRLQILRRLLTKGEATVDDLRNELSMSADAVSRHTSKLRRRGYITVRKAADGSLVFALAPTRKSAIHKRLFEIVRRAWEA
ncbi:MAG: ArsR family transcriptional regulator [Planctomycetes bacterium]|nr:ArsR family transcriptional regulator [Planctomycetota bacterium]